MKKIYGILFLLALMAFKTNLQAQTPCDAVTVTVIAPAPQTGANNYFGARVSIAQPYSENVTVNGILFEDGNHPNNIPFTLTIIAGELLAETADTYFQLGPASSAGAEISSVTPCPANVDATTLGNKHNQVVDYLNSYDFSGKSQDDFMDDVFYYTASIIDPSVFPNGRFGIWGTIWACGKADPSGLSTYQTYDGVLTLLEQNGKISSSSKTFLDSLVSEIGNNDDYIAFSTRINQLESGYNIASLPESEKFIVQGALSVFKESAFYWNNYYGPDEFTEDPRARFSLRFRCFLCVAKNDLKGILLGFLIGNCICTKFGVANPAICGAVGGVAFGALYSWAAKVCPDICNRCRKPSTSSYPSWICRLPFLYWP